MALLFIDGFDHYDPQAVDAFGDPWLARGKAAYLSPQANRINGRRPSSDALRLPEGTGGGYVKNLDATKTSLIVGAAVRVVPFQNTGVEPLLIGVRDANSQVAHLVKIGEDGRLKLYRWQYGYDQLISTSVATAPARGWHYVELQVTQGTSNGVLSVRINGILAIQMAAQNTIQGGGQLLTAFVGAVPGQSCPLTLDVDDFYIADTTGTINNTFLGDVRVDALQAQADGSLNQWTASPVHRHQRGKQRFAPVLRRDATAGDGHACHLRRATDDARPKDRRWSGQGERSRGERRADRNQCRHHLAGTTGVAEHAVRAQSQWQRAVDGGRLQCG